MSGKRLVLKIFQHPKCFKIINGYFSFILTGPDQYRKYSFYNKT